MKKLFLLLSVAAFSFSVSASVLKGDDKEKDKKETKKECAKSGKSCCKDKSAKACAKAGEEKSCHDSKGEKKADTKAKAADVK